MDISGIIWSIKQKQNRNMAELTGMESILNKSHYRTDRKNKYSFGKSQRFSESKSNYTIDYFDSSIPRGTRTCSFGYGNKCFFVPPANNPCASAYNMQSDKKVGITFGVSREKSLAGDFLNKTIIDKSPPSNKYNPNFDSISKFANSSKFSIRKKSPSDSFLKLNPNPEPSKYNQSLEREGKVTVSNFRNPKKAVFSKSERFIELQNSLIGPGQYDAKQENSSRNRSSKKNIFSRAAKTTFTMEMMKAGKDKSPGPIYYLP